jgi:hypothetical protein
MACISAARVLSTLRTYFISASSAHNHPEITWAPRMYPTTALLLHYMTEPQAYDAMCALYRSNKVANDGEGGGPRVSEEEV